MEASRVVNLPTTVDNQGYFLHSTTVRQNEIITSSHNNSRSSSLDSLNNPRRNVGPSISNAHTTRSEAPIQNRTPNPSQTPVHSNNLSQIDHRVSLFPSQGFTITHNQLSLLNSPIDPTTVQIQAHIGTLDQIQNQKITTITPQP